MICTYSKNPPSSCQSSARGTTEDESTEHKEDTATGSTPPTDESSPVSYTLFFQYDEDSADTRWYIEDVQSGELVYEYDFGDIVEPFYNIWGKIELVQGHDYRLGLEDLKGDGMDGFVAIFKKTGDETEVTLVEDDGDFGSGTTHTFTA